MATFEFTSPEGKTYEIEGPAGSTKEQAFSKFQEMRPELFGKKAAETVSTKPELTPSGFDVSQIPSQSVKAPPVTKLAGEPSYLEKASMAASAVPAAGLASQALKFGTQATRLAPYTSRLAELLTPTTGTQLALQTGGAAASAIPAEFARSEVEKRGGSPITQLLTELGVGLGTALTGGGLVAGGKKVYDIASSAMSSEAKKLSEVLASYGEANIKQMLEKTGLTKSQAEQRLSDAKKQLADAQKAERQLSQREVVAGERAEAQQFLLPEQQVKQQVANRALMESSAARRNAEAAGLDVKAAQELATEASQRVQAASAAVDQLEQQLLAQPQISKEKFGGMMQQLVDKFTKTYTQARSDKSGFSAAMESSDVVPTTNILDIVKNEMKDIRNPPLQKELLEINRLAMTEKNAALSVKAAQSLKTYLDSKIAAREGSDLAVDANTKRVLQTIKKQLVENMTNASQAYKLALGKWNTLSRPLDIVERNGALTKVADRDPLSTEYKMGEAEVVGHIISKAKAGHPVFTRLLSEDPSLKEPARLYFTKELFGQETAPTLASFNTFLKSNESSLRQLGLYDEFKTMRNAKNAADRAVYEAKGLEAYAKKDVTEASKAETEAKREASRLAGRTEEAAKRAAQAAGEIPSVEQLLKESKARAKPGEVAVGQRLEAARSQISGEMKTIENQEKIATEFRDLQSAVRSAKPKEIPKLVENMSDRLRDLGHINQKERDFIVSETKRNADQFMEKGRALIMMRRIGSAIGVPALAAGIYGYGYGGQGTK
jgi:hypothetical protein